MKMQNNNLKFIYWGTPEVASRTLEILIKSGYIPQAVVTSPNKPAGRGLHLIPTPVKILAEKYNIEVISPEKIDQEFTNKLSNFKTELNIVVAYGKILPQNIIDLPIYSTINIHYSLLPKYRGASPLESALLNGDMETGVTIQKMALKMDTGPIIATEKINIDDQITKDILKEKLIDLGAKLLVKILPDYLEGNITLKNQNENEVSYCTKIEKKDGEINLNGDAQSNWNKYRAYSGWPGVFFFKDGKRIKITQACFEDGKFIIKKIIPEGKAEQDYRL